MKNNDWICLPIWIYGFYPREIVNLAKTIKSHDQSLEDACKEIAAGKKVEPGKYINRWFPRDKMDILEIIQEDPDNENVSNLLFEDEDFHMVNMKNDKLMSKIHKFLLAKPAYRELSEERTEVHYIPVSQEERDEMEGEDD